MSDWDNHPLVVSFTAFGRRLDRRHAAERAVIDAAKDWHHRGSWRELHAAVITLIEAETDQEPA